jgi:hypothetical protein
MKFKNKYFIAYVSESWDDSRNPWYFNTTTEDYPLDWLLKQMDDDEQKITILFWEKVSLDRETEDAIDSY